MSEQGAARAGKRLTIFISNEEMDEVETVQSLEKSGRLTDGVIKTAKHGIEKQEDGFLVAMMAPTCSFIDCTFGFFIDKTSSFFIDKHYL